MKTIVSREDAKTVINMLRLKQPRTFEEFRNALGMRPFEVEKLLRILENTKVIITETLSGEEKFWLNEVQAVDFLGRKPQQVKAIKHPKGRKPKEKPDPENPVYG